ncbi:hypothetical protein XENORESO_021149 [Xenotaenia resolanae]|uniref:Leptin receptor overlapping transcript-like 1 n=1 Tax=Xenotaenia resolanae TaxID=208358 RepID=A0ABV0X012_9TELE
MIPPRSSAGSLMLLRVSGASVMMIQSDLLFLSYSSHQPLLRRGHRPHVTSVHPASPCEYLCVLHLSCFLFFFSSKYWPLFLLFFYILSPIPYCISRRVVDDTDSASNACKELAIFFTTGIVISAFGLPIVFARAEVVSHGNLLVLTICVGRY